jgi:hypothetical protein
MIVKYMIVIYKVNDVKTRVTCEKLKLIRLLNQTSINFYWPDTNDGCIIGVRKLQQYLVIYQRYNCIKVKII